MKTMKEATKQASKWFHHPPLGYLVSSPHHFSLWFQFIISVPAHNLGTIEDLTDLLANDWAQLGLVREIGDSNKQFFCREMEATWGKKHLAVLPEDKAKWIHGVSHHFIKVNIMVVQ